MFCNVGFADNHGECTQGDCNNGYGTFTFTDGSKYVGEYKDGKKHGQGTLTLADGSKYIGEFENNVGHGQGTMTLADGQKYVGEFKDGKKYGPNTYISPEEEKRIAEEEKRIAEAGEDLYGKKLYCKGSNILDFSRMFDVEEIAAIVFNKNHQATLSYGYAMDGTFDGYYTSQKIFGYKAEEDVIIIRTKANRKIKLDMRLNRETLKLHVGFNMVSRPTCKIVNYDPLEKFEKEIKKIEATKKKKKKI